MVKPHAVDDGSPFPLPTLGQEPGISTHVTDTAHDTIITSTTLDFEEYLDLDKEKDHHKADPDGLEQSYANATEATPIQLITSSGTTSMEQERTALSLQSEQLIRELPDWLMSDGNASYNLKEYLSHEVRAVRVELTPDNGVIQFDTEKWVLSYKVSNSECHQCVIVIRAYAAQVEDHKLFFAYNDIDPVPSLESEYNGIFFALRAAVNF